MNRDSNRAIATQQTSQGQSSRPLDRVSELSRTLAPVRPVGMNDEMASDWSAVIIVECRGLTDAEFRAGCSYARRHCSDHRGVLKAIFEGASSAKPDFASKFATEWSMMVRGEDQKQIGGARPIGKLIEGRCD